MKQLSTHNAAKEQMPEKPATRATQALSACPPLPDALREALQGTEIDWQRIVEAIADPICVVTTSYELVYANAAYIALLGPAYTPPRRHVCYSASGASEPCPNCPLPDVVRTRRPGYIQQELSVGTQAGNGSQRIFQRWIYPVLAADGAVELVVEMLKDVTEQELMRVEAAQATAIREADRLKAELLGTVSHELRSPLAAIKGYAATLVRHEHRLGREERHEFLLAIDEASNRLEVIINRLLEMSELETGTLVPRMEPLQVEPLVREAITSAQARRNNSAGSATGTGDTTRFALTVALQGQEELPLIQADPRLLRDALDIVLENAMNYSPAGGPIRITVRPDKSMLVISVQDNGIGIPPDHLGRIFDRFHRVDSSLTRTVDGLGLGLAICKRIMELHGGAVWAESEPEVGSTFYLALPWLPA